MSKLELLLEQLQEDGFDRSWINHEEETVRVCCSQCEALVINGIATHELGCPNKQRDDW